MTILLLIALFALGMVEIVHHHHGIEVGDVRELAP